MTARLRVAMVGAGYFARFHRDAWRRLPEVEVVGIADADGARAAAAAAEHPGAGAWTDASAMLAELRPDLVDIATPPDSHAALVEAALGRVGAIICQKPLAPTAAAARAIVAAADRAGVPLLVHENFRFMPWHREARRLIDAGAFGPVFQAAFRLRPGDGQGPGAYLDRQPYFQRMERFLVHETAVHLVDTFRYLLGEATGVFARLRRLNPAIRGEDAGLIVLAFASGAEAVFDGNRLVGSGAADPRLTMGTMTVEGAAGSLRLDGDGALWWTGHGARERPHPYAWRADGFGGDCVLAFQRHVVAHLRDGAPAETGARAYLRNVDLVEAIYRSAAEGRWIEV